MILREILAFNFIILISTSISSNFSTTVKNDGGIEEILYSSTLAPTTTSESITEVVAECDVNLNCTDFNSTTEEAKNSNNGSKLKAGKGENQKQQFYYRAGQDICTCNLQISFCDINCCCDPECSAHDKEIFKFCATDGNRFVDDRYCNYIKDMYINNTLFKWEVNQDGLFCIINRNLPISYLEQREKPLGSMKNLKPEMSFWQEEFNDLGKRFLLLSSKHYEFGDPIFIVRNDSKIDTLRTPMNILMQPCMFEQELYFLKDRRTVCSQVNIDEDNKMLSFLTFFNEIKVVSNPKFINLAKVKGSLYHNCPKDVCLQIEPKICNIHLTNCLNLKNIIEVKTKISYDMKNNLNKCWNCVRRVHYRFFHNGTNGIVKVEVLGVISNFSYHFGPKDFELVQEFSLEFLWLNQTKNYSQLLSGNPGYLMEKPILIGNKISHSNITIIARNSSIFVDNFLSFFSSVQNNNKCVRNDTYKTIIDFGYNEKIKCRLKKYLTFDNSQHATYICKQIQQVIFDMWGISYRDSYSSKVFGFFGNAMSTLEKDWGDILYNTKPIKFLNQTKGNFTNRNSTLLCYNFSTLLEVEIFYSRVDLKTILNQNKILGIYFIFHNLKNETFSLERFNNSLGLNISLDLVSQVTFYDITTKKKKKFVEPPTFDIHLPYDFFYPFIKIAGGTNGFLTPSYVILVILPLMTIYVNQ